jgi:5-oxoprolinase (ATP-hydrolysing)
LHIKKPSTLYGDVVEVDERVTLVGYASDPEQASNAITWTEDGKVEKPYSGEGTHQGFGGEGMEVRRGLSGEAVHIMKEIDEAAVKADLQALYEKGYRSIAVVLAHS